VLVPVTVQIKNKDITFEEKDGIQRGLVNIFGRVTTLTGRIAQTFEDTVQVDVPAELLPKTVQNAYVYWKAMPLSPGRYRMDIVVKDVKGDRMGTWSRGIMVPEYSDDKLASSTLILADQMEKVPAKSVGAGNFVIGNTKVRPRLDSSDGKPASFHRNQNVNFWMQVYNLGIDDKSKKPSATIEYDIVNSATNKAVVHAVENTETMGNVGEQLTCIFVDNGLLRSGEPRRVVDTFEQHLGMRLIHVDAADSFLGRLNGVTDPEEKRRIVGDEFIRIFAHEARKLGHIDFLAQGTLYPDVIESTSHDTTSAASRIKTHHNVGLPENLPFRLIEPLRYLFKDEVREVGAAVGLPEEIVWRHPFPGPGLSIRVLGEVTEQRLSTLRAADAIVMDEVRAAGLYRQLWQSFAVLTPLRTVGVMGDYRTYGNVVAVRMVSSQDAMTADWARVSYDLLAKLSSRIVNEVADVNRVVYDITSKPPGTIEWE